MNDAMFLGESMLNKELDELRAKVSALNKRLSTWDKVINDLKEVEEYCPEMYKPEKVLHSEKLRQETFAHKEAVMLRIELIEEELRELEQNSSDEWYDDESAEAYTESDMDDNGVELNEDSKETSSLSDERKDFLTNSQIESQTLLKLVEVSTTIIQDESFIGTMTPKQTRVSHATILAQIQLEAHLEQESPKLPDSSHEQPCISFQQVLAFTLEQVQSYQYSILDVRPRYLWEMKKRKESDQKQQQDLEEQGTLSLSMVKIRDSIYSKDPRLLQTIDQMCYYTQLFSRQVLLLGTNRQPYCLVFEESRSKQIIVQVSQTLNKPQDLREGRHVFEWWQEQYKATALSEGESIDSPISLLLPQDLRAGRYIFEWWQDLQRGTQDLKMAQSIESDLAIRKISTSLGNLDYCTIEEAQFPLVRRQFPKKDFSSQEEDDLSPINLEVGKEDDLSPQKSPYCFELTKILQYFPQAQRKEAGNSPHGIIPCCGNHGYSTIYSMITQCRGIEIPDSQTEETFKNFTANLTVRISQYYEEFLRISKVSQTYQTAQHFLLYLVLAAVIQCRLPVHSQNHYQLSSSVISTIESGDYSKFPTELRQYNKQEDTLGICINTVEVSATSLILMIASLHLQEISVSLLRRVIPRLERLKIRVILSDYSVTEQQLVIIKQIFGYNYLKMTAQQNSSRDQDWYFRVCLPGANLVFFAPQELWTTEISLSSHDFFACAEVIGPSFKSFFEMLDFSVILQTLNQTRTNLYSEQALLRCLGWQNEYR
ncbi:UNKNOWN [Stylonychia lemnae]|uniref:Uncharacterized protein n=1 Tax=Stylonychia lemnae TaxID=5949 RepID=A0A078B0G4_STYLE|nr:UNKNOWN [Stylonychia lemnae]|eukprot:CDW88145.1 UNKNOWN [Stylonychia lemnae]